MNLINNEMKRLYEWSQKEGESYESESIMTPIDKSMASYWEKFDSEDNMTEYNFNSIPEFKELFNKYSTQSELMSIITVATFKKRQGNVLQNERKRNEEKDSIPEFVYTI